MQRHTMSQSSVDSKSNFSAPGFCGLPEEKACGFGDGVGAASIIGLMVAASGLGSVVGSLLGAWVSDWMSRKYGLMLGSAVFAVGGSVATAAYHGYEWMLILGRFLSGIAIGLFYTIMPIYLAEVTPKDSRGLLGSMIGPTYGLGFMVSLLANIGWDKFDFGWRLSISQTVVIGLVAVIGFKFIPHSPRWLVKKQRDQEALMVLSKIYYHSKKETFVDTYLELENLKESVEMASSSKFLVTAKEFCQWKYIYRFLLTSSLFILEATGVFCVHYALTFFCKVGASPFIAAMVAGVVVLAASMVTIIFVDKIGRRALFLSCISVILPWVINSEVFPTKIRGLTVGIAASIFWLSTFVSNLLTPIILNSLIEIDSFMYITAGLNLIGFILIFFAMPETKGVTLEEMDELFSKTFWQRFKGETRCNNSTVPVKAAVNVLNTVQCPTHLTLCEKTSS